MLRKILILSCAIMQFYISAFAYSEDSLANIEMAKYGMIYNDDDLGTRLRRLETDFFGMAQSGDLDKRISMLEQMTGNERMSAIMPPVSSYYPTGKKPSAIRSFFNNITSPLSSNGMVTGFTPSLGNMGYSNNVYGNAYNNFLNSPNYFCPHNNSFYSNNRRGFFNRHRHFYNRRHGYRNGYRYGYNRPYNYNNYRNYHNAYANPYSTMPGIIPNDSVRNVATRSAVHILKD